MSVALAALQSDPYDSWLSANVRARRVDRFRPSQIDQARVSRLQPQAPQYVSENISDRSQQLNAPSSPAQHGGDHMPQSIGTTPKNLGTSADPKSETRTSLHRALTVHVTDPAKIVARRTGASIDTVDNHRSGNVPQSWTQLIAYCRAYPAFGLEVLELMGIDIDADRNAYGLFLMLQKQVRGQ